MDVANYIHAAKIFIQLLGLVYFFVFSSFILQIRGLIGKNGILPAGIFLQQIKFRFGSKAYYYLPSIFWINSSNAFLVGVTIVGTIASLLLLFGVFPPLMLILLYVLHLSIVSVGQDFLSFGWEMFLLEITMNAFFLSWTEVPNPLIWFSLNLLLFRFHFQAGAVKLQSRDMTWSNFTALAFHYQTQPIPNTQAWFFHKLPLAFHKASTAFMFIAEMGFAFLIFGTEEMRLLTWFILVGLQLMIWFSGNFSYLNHLTIVLCTILISDTYFNPFLGIPHPALTPLWETIVLSTLGTLLVFIQCIRLYHHFFWNSWFSTILSWFSPFHLANRYGIFAVMTTKRYEIIVEGSEDGKVWKEYCFKYKPSEVDRRPRRISPFQPRLDWQIWFLPFSMFETQVWFKNFLIRLLQNTPEVLSLLRVNPFPDHPPKYVRALVYDYIFSDFKTLRKDGSWWKRTYIYPYSPTLFLQNKE